MLYIEEMRDAAKAEDNVSPPQTGHHVFTTTSPASVGQLLNAANRIKPVRIYVAKQRGVSDANLKLQ
jgi:type II secretory ATPase GspE/PulE/Tfp pilus assembly ATPase PilB-like protein